MISLIDYKVEENLIRWNATELDSELFIESVRKEENSSNYTYQLVDENAPCNETRDLCKEYEAFEAAVVIILCGLIVITVIGNTLIISAVLTTKRLRTVTNCFVTSLAVADLLVGTFVMPPAIAVHVRGEWELGWILCDIWISLDILLCTASILSLCAISIDRYLAVTRPLTYSRRRRSKKLALTMILFVWIAAGAITCPPMLGWYEPDHNQGGVCRYNQNAGYVVFSAMGSFFLPMIVMVYVYARISCVVARRHQQLASTASKCTKKGNLSCIRTESDSGSDKHSLRKSTSKQTSISQSYPQEQKCPCCFRTERRQKYKKEKERESKFIEFKANYKYKSSRITRRTQSLRDHENNRVSSLRRETKTAQTLSVVVGGFIACWLPFFLYYLMTPFIPSSYVYPVLMCVLTWLGWFNSAINPFIYAFYAPDFRLAFWRLTIKKCKRSKH